jgi:uncharacterized membrane protein
MKLFGHPLHIMLIHFPAALLPMELVGYAIYYFTGDASFATASFYAMAAGVLLGIPAAITGLIDLVGIPAEKPAAQRAALLHGSVNAVALLGYAVLLIAAWKRFPALPAAAAGVLAVKALLNLILIYGNYLGGELILRHKTAVKP